MGLNLEGSLLAERYEIQARLASGGMSVVYRAWDRHLLRPLAIKVLRDSDQLDVARIARFRREAHVASLLHSPYIVESYDFFCEAAHYFMAMELIEGPHLKSYIMARGKLASDDALLIAEQVCLALVEAHALGFLHRDIKPQNILLDSSGNAKLADFGIVHIAAARGLTTDGIVLGTADYISPEQAQGLELRPTSDLYSLGVVLFEMLAGVLPFHGTTSLVVAMQHATMPPPPLRRVAPEVPREIEQLVHRALSKEPGQRFQSAYEMSLALRRAREKVDLYPSGLYRPYSWVETKLASPIDWRTLADRLRESAGYARSAFPTYPDRGHRSSHEGAFRGKGIASNLSAAVSLICHRTHDLTPLVIAALTCLLVFLFLAIVFLHALG
jgi:eukaryotic-like serine/threonine-protein kinase